jgi:hypothetical protein
VIENKGQENVKVEPYQKKGVTPRSSEPSQGKRARFLEEFEKKRIRRVAVRQWPVFSLPSKGTRLSDARQPQCYA